MSNTRSKRKKHSHKHKAVLPYITTPLIFVLISMLVLVPLGTGAMNYAVKTAHSVQEVLSKDYNDISAYTEYEGSAVEKGSVKIPELNVAQKIGVMTCEGAGLSSDIFYGMNRVSLRNGVAMNSKGSRFGLGGSVEIYGYRSKHFKQLESLEEGDVIKVETLWGTYKYRVSTKAVLPTAPYTSGKECLILATEEDSMAFSAFNHSKLFVVADKVSGPDAEEVAK